MGGCHKNFRPLGFCALALKSARTAWFQTSPRNPSGIPTKTCWLFFFSQSLSPFLSNLVLLSSSNLAPGLKNKQPCAFNLKQPCAGSEKQATLCSGGATRHFSPLGHATWQFVCVPLGTQVLWDRKRSPLGLTRKRKVDKSGPLGRSDLPLGLRKLFHVSQV